MELDSYHMFISNMEKYRAELGELPAPAWAEQTGEWDEAREAGVTDGSRPQDLASRAEVAAMILRGR